MEIGSKIRNARNNAGLTQEQVAEQLGVSRQSISNWENNRSYPDIISVIKMSDLYSVSLDHLLKDREEVQTMNNGYYEYLKESTDVVKSNNRRSKIIELGAYLIIWAISVLCFYTMNPGDEMGYVILTTYCVLPVTTIVISAIIGHDSGWSREKWYMPAFFGIMYAVSTMVTFGFAYGDIMVYADDYLIMLLIGMAMSVVGIAAGTAFSEADGKKFVRAVVIIIGSLIVVSGLLIFAANAYNDYIIDQKPVVEDID